MKYIEFFRAGRRRYQRKPWLTGVAAGIMVMAVTAAAQSTGVRPIWFGTMLTADTVIGKAQKLAQSLAAPSSSKWRAKGDQKRTYRFPEANADEPYRLCVPASWDGTSKLPLVMFLHGAGSNENTYLDANNKQMITLASQHGFLLVSPSGDQGAYGNYLRLTAPFGDSVSAANLMTQVTAASERTNQLSEQEVINVLELVLAEYPIDRDAMFLTGHSMGSGGTWLIGGKYRKYWRAIAPMSGPFVQKSGYPWDRVREIPVFITEGIQTPSLNASRLLRDWMNAQTMKLSYKEVDADHGGMVSKVLPEVFGFFDSCKAVAVPVVRQTNGCRPAYTFHARFTSSRTVCVTFPPELCCSGNASVAIVDIKGAALYVRSVPVVGGEAFLQGVRLCPGVYRIMSGDGAMRGSAVLAVTR